MIAAAACCSTSRSAPSSSGSASGSSPPASPLVQHTSQPVEPSSIHRAAVPAGPKSASSGWPATTMNRPGRHEWGESFIAAVPPCGPVVSPRVAGLSFRPRLRSSPPTSEASTRGRNTHSRGPRRGPVPSTRASRERSAGGSRAGGLGRIERRDHLGGMALRLDLRPGSRDAAVRVDQERRPGDAHVGPAVVLLLDPRAVRLGDRVVRVGEEEERQSELLAEGPLALGALRADPPDVSTALVDGLVGVAELAGLDRAAGGVVLRVEVDDRPTAALIGESVDRAGLVREADLGSEVTRFGNAHFESVAGVSMTRIRPDPT